ncbi:ABC transporter permease [Paenibacillus thiaminolyticus]|uniref:ABC transporter permease n=1 Tax=Paenibacillus thiaminolyticus TaxID=49283 RepID=A0AAP9J1B8_PANTH|nr:ABC transporter permease [Paenibacillus thiaminolyticus]MCY9534847.1 ABC transporter permease [Paenibacillus thiaminolyticus]MCY9605224.1 ABC transporter permease [Paenibacillus thiaminolyticus]MCY9610107.1 ABC transporter permease [Paenibacillus thiaminolyticus]MCY9615283.1 ABC transporter permease [Paenibacillus thiaminolyticus]MCY9622302.1 ABC transporter permease [Paenibacillus thiaminolyticus]
MLELMRLEWEKSNVSSYFRGLAICIVAIFAAVALMARGSHGEGEPMFPDYAAFMSLTNILIRIVYIIFSSVILSRVVIEEYKSNMIQVLFTYPQQRKKIMQAKLSIVFGFCFFSILLTTVIINLFIFFLNPMIGLFEASVRVDEIAATVPATLLNAFMIAGISLIPLSFGMRKKSAASTITSAVVIGFVINATVSDGGSSTSLFQFIGIPIALCLLGLIIGYLSFYKVDQIDVA